MLNKLNNFFRSILFFYILFFIANALIVIGLSNITKEYHFTIISIIGALMLIVSLSVIFAPPIIRLKNIFSDFILRKNTWTDITTSEFSPHKIPYHFSFLENLVIVATVVGIFFVGIIIYVLFSIFFKKISFL